MAHTTRENVEILVHTSAPSRGQDDTRYRAFASAYLNFEPATYLQLQDDPQLSGANEEGSEVRIEEELHHSTQGYDENASYCPPTQEPETNLGAYHEITEEELSDLICSPQLSFRSVLDNRNSPRFRTRSGAAMSLRMQSGEEIPGRSQDGLEMQTVEETPWRTQFLDSVPAQTQSSSVGEDFLADNDRLITQFSSPTRILELHQQQGESTQDSPVVRRGSQFTDVSSLNLEVPRAIPFISSQSAETHTNLGIAPSLSPGHSPITSPPRRAHITRFRHITPSPVSAFHRDAPNSMSSNNPNSMQSFGQAANTSNRRTSQTMEKEIAADFTNEDVNLSEFSKKGPISGIPEKLETSSSLPQHANSKRRRVDFPSSVDKSPKSPKRVKLVISDTTSDASSRSLPSPQTRPTSMAHDAPDVSGTIAPMSSLASSKSLATCIIPSFIPQTSSGDLTPANLVTTSLGLLVSIQELRAVYKPTLQTRPCRPFERGYWLVDIQSLDYHVKQNLWSYLFRHISKGDSGWGVSAERTDDWKSVRVNCWGGVVKEIYTLLFIASESKMQVGDACWKDGGGETVVSC
ncbi:7b3bdc61-a740-45c4-aceb-0263b7072f41 [Sclerotinia trifoliorum]|uniref:7b3bdc61-a740-45c4-aceb-0263b7072f41 n=1 Tax=Sclerotinia trifoliorum TaxID=28548 RepID=A0A8H2W3G7_9HELO|nr:7b3bdc61-a740-45c4-aceb-0263b7072f41 [Sclerotinia trifoliorum]